MKQYKGLSKDQVEQSRKENGGNKLQRRKKKSFFRRYLSNFSDPIIRVLLAALLVNIIFTLQNLNVLECVGIVMAIIISTLVSTLSECGSENAFEKLVESAEVTKVKVFRDSSLCEISIDELVVGDIVSVGAGESVPADGIILEGVLSVDQSALNGESRESKKKALSTTTKCDLEAENWLFRGSLVTQGSSVFRVTSVGENTFFGGVASDLSVDTRESPMKLRLGKLAKLISRLGYIVAAIVAASYLFGKIVIDNHYNRTMIYQSLTDVRGILSLCIGALTLAITIVVVAVPEGLPMMICVVLSSNMRRMLKDQILVKKLVGIETAGSINILFCDKTGTITTGVQSVEGVVLYDGGFKKKLDADKESLLQHYLVQSARYNTECVLVSGKPSGSNATDRAIADYFAQGSLIGPIYGGVPFNSRYKYSAAKLPSGEVVIKGAPEILFPFIRLALDYKGNRVPFDCKSVTKAYRSLAKRSVRLVAVAVADEMPNALGFGSLTFIGLIAIRDKVRETAKESIKTLHEAGVSVIMMTGDGPETARSIAIETGIISDSRRQVVMTGTELAAISDDEVAEMLPNIAVLARALPQDKVRLVRIAQRLNLVVGMTGDGVNDAPALKLADVGFAMGSGTDIAKEAGDIVILDNDISAIVKAVLYGRTIFKSIQKFIVFQLTMNLCAVGVTLLGPLFGIDTPITIIQMLWVNIIMDTLGGLAFSGEAATMDTMREQPKSRDQSLLSADMIAKILWNGFSTVMVCIAFMGFDFFKRTLQYEKDSLLFYSSFFSLFIFLGIMNFYNARTERLNLFAGLKRNRLFVVITVLVALIQLVMVYFGGEVFRTVPLHPRLLLGLASLSVVVLPCDLIRKAVMKIGNNTSRQNGTKHIIKLVGEK